MSSNPIVLLVLVIGVGTGALIDLRTRRVPNVLTVGLAATGVVCAAAGVSGLSLRGALVGCAFGLLLMLPGHLIGATGAGDVKLFAAVGTLIGPAHIGLAFVYTAIAGGALALVVAASRRRLGLTFAAAGGLVAARAQSVDRIEDPRANNRFAYAPAIAAGSLLAAFGF